MPATTEVPGFRECWTAARGVASSEHARDVVALLRPRTFGVSRDRAPIWLQLGRAAREGRLVWHGPSSFAALRAPADRPISAAGRLLRRIDRQWFAVVLVGQAVAMMFPLLILFLLRDLISRPTLLWAGLITELLVVGFFAVDRVTALVQVAWRGLRSLTRPRPRPDETAALNLPYEHWSIMLCHHDSDLGGEALLNDVARRLTVLAGDDVALTCPTRSITTTAMRTVVAGWADGLPTGVDRPEVSVRMPRHRPIRAHRVMETGAFFFLWLAGVAVAVISAASFVSGTERASCVDDCTGRPVTFAGALEWAAHRLVWQDPPGVHAVTFQARSLGFLIGLMSLMTVGVAAASLVRYRHYLRSLQRDREALWDDALAQNRVLLLVATETERKAVLERANGRLDFSGEHPVYRLDVPGDVEVILAQTGTGITGPLSAAYSVPGLIASWQPRFVIMVGICYGLDEQRQSLGDVIVGTRLRTINLRVGADETRDRGEVVDAGHRLVRAFEVAEDPPGAKVWRGELISWDVLVDFAGLRAAIKARYRDALGGEMEGAAVRAASVRAGTEWIVVKGICDWGHDKDDTMQRTAAANAATAVLDLIGAGALAHRH